MNDKKRNGFTLVEILGVIVVIGLLFIIIVPNIVNQLNKHKIEIAELQQKTMFNSAEEYFTKTDVYYGKISNKTYCVSLKTLQENNFADPDIVNALTGKSYDAEKTYVVGKTGTNAKLIEYSLNENGTCGDKITTCTITKSESGLITYIGKDGLFTSDKSKFLNECHFDNGIAIKTSPSGWAKQKEVKIIYSGSNLDTFTNNIKGENITTTKISNDLTITTGLIKENQTIVGSAVRNLQTGSEPIVNTYTENKIDNTKPDCNFTSNGTYNFSTTWFLSHPTLTLKGTDTQSPISRIYIKHNNKKEQDTKNIKNKTYSLTKNITKDISDDGEYSGYVSDSAGNISTCNLKYVNTTIDKLKVDTKKPALEVTYIKNNSKNTYTSGSWSTEKLNRNISSSDPKKDNSSSGLKTTQYCNSNCDDENNWKNENNLKNYSIDNQEYYVKFRAIDRAGNKTETNNQHIMVDTIAPTCNMNVSGTKGRNDWYISDVSFSVKSDDNLSGVVETSKNPSENKINYDTKEKTVTATTKDNAGNTNTCKKTVKRDATDPSISVSYKQVGTNNEYSSGICSSSELERRITYNADVSGKNKIEYSTDNGASWHDEGNVSYHKEGNQRSKEKFRITDNAGHTAETHNTVLKIGNCYCSKISSMINKEIYPVDHRVADRSSPGNDVLGRMIITSVNTDSCSSVKINVKIRRNNKFTNGGDEKQNDGTLCLSKGTDSDRCSLTPSSGGSVDGHMWKDETNADFHNYSATFDTSSLENGEYRLILISGWPCSKFTAPAAQNGSYPIIKIQK